MSPNSSRQFVFLRAMYCYRKDLPSTSSTSGTRVNLNSIIRNGLIPGGKNFKRGRQAVFCTTVNAMEDANGMGENCTRLDETKDRPIQIFLQDLSQTKKINKFSEQSKDLIADMNNTEIFELCENSSQQQYPECNTYPFPRKINCSLWKYGIFAETNRVFEQNNYDVTSIP